MSTLVSGSVAEQNPLDYVRSSSYRSTGAYDPFMARPHGRYSPPRADFISGSSSEHYGSSRILPLYEGVPSHLANFVTSSPFSAADALSYAHHDNLQRATIIEDDRSSRRQSQDSFGPRTASPQSQNYMEYDFELQRHGSETGRNQPRYHSRRRPFNQDEFDGPSQYLPLPLPHQDASRAQDLTDLPVHLDISEQEDVMRRANDILSECAFHFIAKYQFPVPLERDKPRVRSAADREWTEWAYLLKRLATKRRIPARVLYDNQIKQLVTTLENSIAARQSAIKEQTHQKRKPKDDRYILQLVSASTQVAKLLMDSLAMEQLNELYGRTEMVILERRQQARRSPRH
ncbi:hypothetical protein LTR05_000657 [Lithohypha guttulata]|uniref:Uncharacterized protein n=1 Tax=Lithohypha guttulata TaxID=1690604 RepID=A0AAN7T6Q2_9EURO|nr:hypothetical protein LTR05_000657 [Lithohypha guttulata]